MRPFGLSGWTVFLVCLAYLVRLVCLVGFVTGTRLTR